MNTTIRVGLVEDQLLFREGMKAIISEWPGFEVVFESSDGCSVSGRLNKLSILPDVMLLDLSLPPHGQKEFSGLTLLNILVTSFPSIKVIILSIHNEELYISQLIREGAHGYLIKDCNPKEVREAIHAVLEKGFYINAHTLKAMQIQRNEPKKINSCVSRREEEILQLVCQQFTAEQIAKELFISVKTVNGHKNNLLRKTGSRNVTGLVLYAIKNRIVTIS